MLFRSERPRLVPESGLLRPAFNFDGFGRRASSVEGGVLPLRVEVGELEGVLKGI